MSKRIKWELAAAEYKIALKKKNDAFDEFIRVQFGDLNIACAAFDLALAEQQACSQALNLLKRSLRID